MVTLLGLTAIAALCMAPPVRAESSPAPQQSRRPENGSLVAGPVTNAPSARVLRLFNENLLSDNFAAIRRAGPHPHSSNLQRIANFSRN